MPARAGPGVHFREGPWPRSRGQAPALTGPGPRPGIGREEVSEPSTTTPTLVTGLAGMRGNPGGAPRTDAPATVDSKMPSTRYFVIANHAPTGRALRAADT